MNAKQIIQQLNMEPHPEGGYYRETYRSQTMLPAASLPPEFNGGRPAGTSIYFLLTGDTFSAFHRLRSDELWHYHIGDSACVHIIHPDGRHEMVKVGPDLADGQQFQCIIPAGTWFAASVENPDGFILTGCTVAPGFDFHDFELADRKTLISQFPQHTELITRYTR